MEAIVRLTIPKKRTGKPIPDQDPLQKPRPPYVPNAGRCEAAHPDDRSLCDGPIHAVEVSDQFARHVRGCLWHGTLLYASLSNAVMFPVLEDAATVDAARRIAYRLRSLYWGYRDPAPEARP